MNGQEMVEIRRDYGSSETVRKWTAEEDQALSEAVNLYGESNWRLVSISVRTRDNGSYFPLILSG
jgi:hypothetical protein